MKSESVRRGRSMPSVVCRFAPPRSASTRTTRFPRRASSIPRFAEMRLLPSPPFPPPMEMTRRARRLGGGNGRRTGSSGMVRTSLRVGASPTAAILDRSSDRLQNPRIRRHPTLAPTISRRPPALFQQLGVPVRGVREREERPPFPVEGASGGAPEHRRPAGSARVPEQPHPGLLRRPPALLQVAGNARADDVLPVGRAPPGAGDDVIEVQVGAPELPAAVLAGGIVPRVDVEAGEADPRLREMLVGEEDDDARHPYP